MSAPDDRLSDGIAQAHLADVGDRFAALRDLAERAIAQVDDAALFRSLGVDDNSIAVLMKHVGGNLQSRFTDLLTTDGEKPERRRDTEFDAAAGESRQEVEARWTAGWRALEGTLATLEPGDLLQTVSMRGEPLTVLQALSRALAHIAQHVGQIVLLAKHAAGSQWRTLSIPRAPRPRAQ